MIRKIFTYALLLALAAGFTACNSSGSDEPQQPVFTDIVTYLGSDGAPSVFSFRKEADSPLVTLTSSRTLNSVDFKVGTRILIQYTTDSGQRYTSGAINLLAAANVEGAGNAIEASTAEKTMNWDSDAIQAYAIFRSGKYVNVQFTGALGAQTAVVRMIADESTLDDEFPDIHIIYGPYTDLATKVYTFFGSWDISSVWDRSTCKGVNIIFKNGGGSLGNPVTILKQGSTGPIKPTDPVPANN